MTAFRANFSATRARARLITATTNKETLHDNENAIFETREEAEGMIRVMVKLRNATKKAAEPRDSRRNYVIMEV